MVPILKTTILTLAFALAKTHATCRPTAASNVAQPTSVITNDVYDSIISAKTIMACPEDNPAPDDRKQRMMQLRQKLQALIVHLQDDNEGTVTSVEDMINLEILEKALMRHDSALPCVAGYMYRRMFLFKHALWFVQVRIAVLTIALGVLPFLCAMVLGWFTQA